MYYRQLGQSELRVSVVSMGCWPIAGDRFWGPQDENDALQAIRAALDCGINFFDTAEAYGDGRSEELLGQTLSGMRARAVIATKVSPNHYHPQDLRASCEASLKRLRTDYIDVYYLHWPNWQVPIAETLGVLQELRQAGKIRLVGYSNFGKQDLAEALQHGRVEVDQLPYSLLWRAIEYEILPTCIEHGIGVACWSPLAESLLAGKFTSPDEVPATRARTRHFSAARPGTRHGEPGVEQETFRTLDSLRQICARAKLPMAQVALAWLIQRPGVATVIAGARNPDQIRMNAAAGTLDLPFELMQELDRVTDELKARLGANPDMWQSNSRIR